MKQYPGGEFGRKDDGRQKKDDPKEKEEPVVLTPEQRLALHKEIKDLSMAVVERDKQINDFVDKAKAEIKDHGSILNSTKTIIENLAKAGDETNARLIEVEQKLARRGGPDAAAAVKSHGQIFTEDDSFKELVKKGRGIARVGFKRPLHIKDVSNLTSATSGQGGVGTAFEPYRIPTIITPQDRPMTIRDLIPSYPTEKNSIEYVQEVEFANNAAVVAEGAAKPQSTFTLDLVTANVRTIAHWMKASRQVLDDIPLLRSYIDGRLRYGLMYAEEAELLTGDGTGQHLLGLLPQATDFDTALRESGDNKIDEVRRAMLQVRLAEFRASGIVLNPRDWTDMELMKDSENRYLWSNPTVNNGQNLWGLPVIDSNAMPAGQFLVGAFNVAAAIYDREDANVQVSTEDSDNFTKNMVTIRAEERLALCVLRKLSFVNGVFQDASQP